MRSTIFTSLVAGVFALPADAAPTLGCFARDYPDAHLAANPDQIVDQIWLKFFKIPFELFQSDDTYASVRIWTANQGHVARDGLGGQVFEAGLHCYTSSTGGADKWGCSIDCDGGSFEILRDDSQVLDIRTGYLMMGYTEDCGGAVDLAERPQQNVTYRLYRVDDAVCDALWPKEES